MTSSRNSIKIWSCIQSCLNKIAGLTLNFYFRNCLSLPLIFVTEFFSLGVYFCIWKNILRKKVTLKELYVILRTIWYHLHNLKNVKNIHGGVVLLVKSLKLALLYGCFSHFLDCTNGTKLHKASHIMYPLVWKRQIL